MAEKKVVGIRFQNVGKLYHFDATYISELLVGDFVIVSTSRGQQMGQVMGVIESPPKPPRGSWKRVERKANPNDLLIRQNLKKKELEVTIECRDKASKLGYEGLKIVASEFSFDSSSLSVLYNTEDQEEINLSKLISFVSKKYPKSKVEFRRIGPRDVAKIVGGMGACGMGIRCCSMFLTEFSPISIRMAKAQGISLDPSEITGMCGRLRCCLIYEYQQYVEARKKMPKRNKKVMTPYGEGKVVDSIPLKEAVLVRVPNEDNKLMEFPLEDLEPLEELEALKKKAKEPCAKHGDGECDCQIPKKSSSKPNRNRNGNHNRKGTKKPGDKKK
jgi:cell fate regulator YaaT (PSP1 superfamily)